MPGRVNPLMPEMLMMVAAQVVGNDAAITLGGASGNFELNVMKPLIAHNLLQSIDILGRGMRAFTEKCVSGLKANAERCQELIEGSTAMVTALAPRIGYDAAAALAKEARHERKTVRQLALEKKVLPAAELEKLLNVRRMTEPGTGL